MSSSLEDIVSTYKQVQDEICEFLIEQTNERYLEDNWEFTKGSGGGRTRVWEGEFIEKGGVNFSYIQGDQLPQAALGSNLHPDTAFHATGISIVIHPKNPQIPTIHLNVRYFQAGDSWWFGGGIDVTPYYPIKSQVIKFHKILQQVCNKHNQNYEAYKQTCDTYFFLPHRQEARGVGGIFFDQLSANAESTHTKEDLLAFSKAVGLAFIDIYRIFLQNSMLPYTDAQREFQLIRRSRYVEFNLLWDRGTKFGIQSQGRTESILMSMPATAIWKYNWSPAPDSVEAHIIEYYLHPQDWVNMDENESE